MPDRGRDTEDDVCPAHDRIVASEPVRVMIRSVRCRRILAVVSGIAVCAAAASCGLDAVGSLESNPGVTGDGGASDGGADGDPNVPIGDASWGDGPCTLPTCDDAGVGCTGGTICTPNVPAGWHLLAYGEDPAVDCGSTYTTFGPAATKVSNTPANCGTCSCTTGAQGTCSGANVALSWSDGAGCTKPAGSYATTGACQVLSGAGFTTAGQNFTMAIELSGAFPACTSVVTPTIPSADGGLVRTCRPPDTSSTCENNRRLCVAAPPPGLGLCIAADLVNGVAPAACPPGFDARSQTVATTLTDNRACSPCGCRAKAGTCNINFTLWDNTTCSSGNSTGSPSTASVCGGYGTGGSSAHYQSGEFTVVGSGAASGGTCVKSGEATPKGAVEAQTGYLVCCAN